MANPGNTPPPLPGVVQLETVRRLLSVIERVEAVPWNGDWKRALLEGLVGVFDAKVGILVEVAGFGTSEPRITDIVDIGWDSPDQRLHLRRYLEGPQVDDPTGLKSHEGLQNAQRIFTWRREDLVDDATWYGSSHYQNFRQPSGIDHYIGSMLKLSTPGWIMAVAVHRPSGAPRFTPEQRDLLSVFHEQCAWLYLRRITSIMEDDAQLPPRLRDVLHCLLAGDAAKQIAHKLELSIHTVHDYIKHLYQRLGVNGRGDLLARYHARRSAGR